MLEEKFIKTIDYVELDTKNYNTFSNEYASLLQTIGAELDLFFKVYCNFDKSDKKNIADYAHEILSTYVDIKSQPITAYDIEFIPFEDWNIDKPAESLEWWKAFTDIKHNRSENMEKASQKNVLYILGALFLLEMKYYRNITADRKEPDAPTNKSKLFSLPGWNSQWISASETMLKFEN